MIRKTILTILACLLTTACFAQKSLRFSGGVAISSDGTNVVVPGLVDTSLSAGKCVETTTGGLLTVTASSCGTSSGTVTVTGAPSSGNLGFFSGGTSVTNGDLTGDVTTSGAATTTVVGVHFGASGLTFGTAPSAGECLLYDGANITGGACSGSGMTWPAAGGIAIYSGSSSWSASKTAPTGTIVGTTDSQTLTNKTVDGATSTEIGYLSGVTSAVQAQLNAKSDRKSVV